MKNEETQQKLKKAARRFLAVKKVKPKQFLNTVVEALDPLGGITGFRVACHQTLTLHNHTASYNVPIPYEEHTGSLSAQGKRAYEFLDHLREHLTVQGVSPRDMEFHLGKYFASKHHTTYQR